MVVYYYEALDSKGTLYKGSKEVEYKELIYEDLKKNGLYLVSLKKRKTFINKKKTFKLKDFEDFFYQMESLIRAHISLKDALIIVAQSHPSFLFRSSLMDVKNQLLQGVPFSKACKILGLDPFTYGLLTIAEKSYSLEKIFHYLFVFFKQKRKRQEALASSFYYPAFLILSILIFFNILLTFVFPSLKSLLNETESPQKLSFLLQLLMDENWNERLKNIFYGIVFISFTLILLFSCSKKTKKFLGRLFSYMPFIKLIIKDLACSQFLKQVGILIAQKMEITQAIENSALSLSESIHEKKFKKLQNLIQKGESFGKACEKIKLFSFSTLHLIKIGETTAQLDTLLEKASDILYQNTLWKIKRIIQWIQPTLIILIGFILLWIVFEVINPIYNMVESLSL